MIKVQTGWVIEGRPIQEVPGSIRDSIAGFMEDAPHAALMAYQRYVESVFLEEGTPSWAPLRPGTRAIRERAGFSPANPILIRTGSYKAALMGEGAQGSLLEQTSMGKGFRLKIGTTDPRFDYHELGTRRMPARPIAPNVEPRRSMLLDEVEGVLVAYMIEAVVQGNAGG